jgi:hypothetical protein
VQDYVLNQAGVPGLLMACLQNFGFDRDFMVVVARLVGRLAYRNPMRFREDRRWATVLSRNLTTFPGDVTLQAETTVAIKVLAYV